MSFIPMTVLYTPCAYRSSRDFFGAPDVGAVLFTKKFSLVSSCQAPACQRNQPCSTSCKSQVPSLLLRLSKNRLGSSPSTGSVVPELSTPMVSPVAFWESRPDTSMKVKGLQC